MSRWRLFPWRRRAEPEPDTVLEPRRAEPDPDTVLGLRRALQGDTALSVIERLLGLEERPAPQGVVGVARALDRVAAAVLETACLSIEMAMPPDPAPPSRNVRERLEAARGVLDGIQETLDPARASQEQIIVAASVRDTLERLSRLAELHASTTGRELTVEPVPAAPGSLERRLVELDEAASDAIGELDAAVRLSGS